MPQKVPEHEKSPPEHQVRKPLELSYDDDSQQKDAHRQNGLKEKFALVNRTSVIHLPGLGQPRRQTETEGASCRIAAGAIPGHGY